ncbi:MAG TPA: NADH-quinone oxidoreductase subunit L [Candidatus Sulfopaludibacter sp.]|nr:NADH-quinone oxidoreductase subunit L [Candidatus Sulfopaludibacter sp.]
MQHELFPWLILFLPLFSAAAITIFTLRSRTISAFLSIGAIVTGFILSVVFISANGWHFAGEISKTWLSIGSLQIDFGLKLDALSMMMLLVVTGVGGAIHIYSVGYMREDSGFSRFFAELSLFTFSMLGIVLANNFIEMFIFWELVGVSSYLLIGFWFEKPSAGDAAKKAFIVNRLGDFGFLLGILMVWGILGSVNFSNLHNQLTTDSAALGTMATIAGLLIFCGAVGKSAQFPLHVWLPDAMEGPTPVSALIHAATMVAAGVYMLCRIFFVLNADALHVIAYIGGFTSLLAALIAIQQDDIKRIIAYSTLSQLGYMVMAVGLSGPTAAMFHLTTHAFFKALLFLSAGSVIIALHHEQDIWKMGNLRNKMPITFWTFLVGALALSGMWPFAGFFSKDSILAQALAQHNYLLFANGVFIAGLTTFYIFRLFFVVFFGKEKSGLASHAHESPAVMTLPLVGLAIFSFIGGYIGIESTYHGMFAGEAGSSAGLAAAIFKPFMDAPVAAVLGLGLVAIGFFAAFSLYAKADQDPLPAMLGPVARWMKNKFYFDELYEATVIRLHDFIAAVMDWIDRWLVEGLCLGLVRGGTDLTGRALRLMQTGNLQTYAFLFVLGVAVVMYFVLGK